MGWTDPLKGLNEQQRSAVECTEGPVLVLAGAGSGKTRVLSHRIAYILTQQQARPWEILAVTFTNKAAAELRERVARIAPDGDKVTAGTFHSVMLRLLRREAKAVGYPSSFSVFDQDDSARLVKEILQDHQGDSNWKERRIHSHISRLKNDMVQPDQFEPAANRPIEAVVALVYKEYEKRKRKLAAMDFDDLLVMPLYLFKDNPTVLANWSARWRFLHVDEYQDTNLAQFELMRMLAGPKANFCAVGDDDQSIYGWRGARVENIFRFREVFEGTKVFRLEQNYRSTQPILDVAHAVVSGSSRREEKKLWTDRHTGAKPSVLSMNSDREEADTICERIARDVMSGKRAYRDFAVLYRTNEQSRAFENALIDRRMPYQIVGSMSFYRRREIKDALAYFRLALNPRDDISLKRIIKEPPRGIGDKTIERLIAFSRQEDISLTEALIQAADVEDLGPRAVKKCVQFGLQLQEWRNAYDRISTAQWTRLVLEGSGFLERLKEGDTFEEQHRLENVEDLLIQIREEIGDAKGGLEGFLERVSLATDIDKFDPAADNIRLMTVHAAKGLEFPVVYLAGLERNLFPLVNEFRESEHDPDEERRLF
ncbi:AAA family ATPase, partial [bacterium]|nr:AAA family ATPase [bacterium]